MAQRKRELTAPDTPGAVATFREPLKRAVLYLRVSTPSQVNTDFNPEGISLPAQRTACQQKAAALGAEVVAEFVEPGRTATTIDKRPVFQEMMAWVKAEKNIDCIVVYHFSRIFRNSIDAAITKKDLNKAGVRVISSILDMGESPESTMVETIIHAVDQYQSEASGADISFKMSAKARTGGTVGRAPIGYLNRRDLSEGRNIGMVEIDPDRAPLVRQAFEL
jgi:site-specific DNA recombinase